MDTTNEVQRIRFKMTAEPIPCTPRANPASADWTPFCVISR
jgi:hypothetical protein